MGKTSPEFEPPLKVTIDWIDVPLQKERGPNGVETRTDRYIPAESWVKVFQLQNRMCMLYISYLDLVLPISS